MRKQLADGDVVGPRQGWEVLRYLVVERQLTLFLQQQEGGGGELFADRADGIAGFGGGGAEGFDEDQLPIFDDGDGCAGSTALFESGGDLVGELAIEIGSFLGGQRQESGNQCEDKAARLHRTIILAPRHSLPGGRMLLGYRAPGRNRLFVGPRRNPACGEFGMDGPSPGVRCRDETRRTQIRIRAASAGSLRHNRPNPAQSRPSSRRTW